MGTCADMGLVTIAEIASECGVGVGAVHDWAKSGRIPSVRYGQQVRFNPVEVRAAIDREAVLVSAAVIAELYGVRCDTVYRWAKARKIPSVMCGKRAMFDAAEVQKAKAVAGMRKCSKCMEILEVGVFPLVKDSRSGKRVPCSQCRACKIALKRSSRVAKADAEGRDIAPYRDRKTIAAEARSGWEALGVKTGADATRARRMIAIRSTQTEPISRVKVAERDGWMCSICGDAVTRSDWSLDHVVPLSRGGTHTYDNVALAHVLCNSRKGAKLDYTQ